MYIGNMDITNNTVHMGEWLNTQEVRKLFIQHFVTQLYNYKTVRWG